jgi:hypothetical protein
MSESKLSTVEIYGTISAIEALTRYELLGWARDEKHKSIKE